MRELETDGVPAPSDIELAAMDAANARRFDLDFNGATKALNICRDRERFHRWAGRFINLSVVYSEAIWQIFYNAFLICDSAREHRIRDEDDRDLHDTQQDSIAPPC